MDEESASILLAYDLLSDKMVLPVLEEMEDDRFIDVVNFPVLEVIGSEGCEHSKDRLKRSDLCDGQYSGE
jgi:hypothetical protein